jgi:hypothetical protein
LALVGHAHQYETLAQFADFDSNRFSSAVFDGVVDGLSHDLDGALRAVILAI